MNWRVEKKGVREIAQVSHEVGNEKSSPGPEFVRIVGQSPGMIEGNGLVEIRGFHGSSFIPPNFLKGAHMCGGRAHEKEYYDPT